MTVEQQTFVVQSLACFDSPSAVAAALKKDFGIVISPQGAEAYDPHKAAGAGLAKRWRELFAATRKAFLEDTSQVGISHRSVRLRALNRMADKAEGQGNIALAAQLHKQAAEEIGGSFTNRREFTGKDDGPMVVEITRFADRTPK